MKKQTKLLSLLLAILMLTVFALPASADLPSYGTITINPPAAPTTGGGVFTLVPDEFDAYQLFFVGANDLSVDEDTGEVAIVYTATDNLKAFLKGLSPEDQALYTDGIDANTDEEEAIEKFLEWLQEQADDSEDMDILANKIVATGFATTGTATPGDGGAVQFLNMPRGYYLVTGKATVAAPATPGPEQPAGPNHTGDGKVTSLNMLFSIPEEGANENPPTDSLNWDVVRRLKADAPQVSKDVWRHPNAGTTSNPNTGAPTTTSLDGGTWEADTDVNIGDTVWFRLNSVVPNMRGYTNYTFIMHDEMSAGLTFINTPAGHGMTITIDGVEYDDFTVTTGTASAPFSHSISITFNNFKQFCTENDIAAGAPIIVVYKTTLNDGALIGADGGENGGNINRVQLEYSRNPGSSETGRTPWYRVRVYTFRLHIFKYTGPLATATPLHGAEFNLYRGNSASGTLLNFIASSDSNYDYEVATTGGSPTLVSRNADPIGMIRIKGLDAGTYHLVETKAPQGYNGGWVSTIEIVHTGGGASHVLIGALPEEQQVVNIQNNTGNLLPGTGGIGVYIFFGVGGVMAIALAAAYIFYWKKRTMNSLDA